MTRRPVPPPAPPVAPRTIDAPVGPPGALIAICERPRLWIVEAFATDDEIDYVTAIGADEAGLAEVGIATQRGHTGFSFELPIAGDPLLEGLAARLRARVGLAAPADTLRFRRYAAGEYHPLHTDAYAAEDGELVLTAMLYLSDVPAGGETHFPRADPRPLAIRPRRGRLVVWFNHREDGARDDAALHDAQPVRDGSKVTVTDFVYQPLAFCATRPDR